MSAETYYVPEQSRLPIWASFGLFLTVFGAAHWLSGNPKGPYIFMAGGLVFATVLWNWFAIVINENIAGMNSPQLKRSYVYGMGWFIFSEAMLFTVFFSALFYVRILAVPWLGAEGDGADNGLLWPGFSAEWPLLTTPDMAAHGDAASRIGPKESMSFPGWSSLLGWLPMWNTIILLTSSVTVHFAHSALKNKSRKGFNIWLGITVLLGAVFLVLQAEEYIHAYNELGLTLQAGIYGSTFFMLTGFHGAHVTIGTFMLFVMWMRSVIKGHFRPDDSFGFEAASWYWHFVDVVWVGLFFIVYVFG